MRRFSWIFMLILTASSAAAQTSTSAEATVDRSASAQATADMPRWDVNLNAGIFGHRPADTVHSYDNWYNEGRYAASIGYYWTENLKTEFEFAHTGEGQLHFEELARVPGSGAPHSVYGQSFHRLQQTSLRMVWQFGDNTWVHPYVSGGYVLDADRQRRFSPLTYSYPGDPRTVPPIIVRPAINSGPDTAYRHGVSLGAGSKFYVAPQAYINTGVQWTYAQPAKTITFYSGFGVEF